MKQFPFVLRLALADRAFAAAPFPPSPPNQWGIVFDHADTLWPRGAA